MDAVNGTKDASRAIPAPLGLARQSFDKRFDGGDPELHGVALIRHAVKPTRQDQHRLPVDFDCTAEEAGFVLGDCEHNVVAADAATERAVSDAIGHSGSSINGRVHCNPGQQRWIAPWAGPDHPTTGISLSGAVFPLGALDQRLDGDPLGFFKSGSARAKWARLDLNHRAVMDVDREQTPLLGTPTPDVGGVRVPGSVYRQRDAMKRLRCLICSHFYRRIYSHPKSASRDQGPQALRAEALIMEALQ